MLSLKKLGIPCLNSLRFEEIKINTLYEAQKYASNIVQIIICFK